MDDPRLSKRNVALHHVSEFVLVGREDPEDDEESEELKRAVFEGGSVDPDAGVPGLQHWPDERQRNVH